MPIPSRAEASRPPWLLVRPLDTASYIGIASSPKTRDGNHAESAKLKALASIASEISIHIVSQSTQKVHEFGDAWIQDYRAEIQATTQSQLEGYDLVATWEDDKAYWVYYRLPKAVYLGLLERRREAAFSKAEALRRQALIAWVRRDAAAALRDFLLAWQQADIAESVGAKRPDGHPATGELKTQLGEVLGKIRMSGDGKRRQAVSGRGLPEPLELRARFADNPAGPPLPGLPVAFAFARGAGELSPALPTDSLGKARARVTRITSREPLQVVRGGVDFAGLLGEDSLPHSLLRLVRSLPAPSASFEVAVAGPKFFLQTTELNLEAPMKVLLLEAAAKNAFGREGFDFTSDSAAADFVLVLEGRSRQGSVVRNLHFSFVDMSVSVREAASGREIFKIASSGIKGGHLDFPRAGLNAFEKAAAMLEAEIVPQALLAIRR